MRQLFWSLLPLFAFAQESMLEKADLLAKRFNVEVAKAPPPLICPQPQSCLNSASVWFSIDLQEIATPTLATLNNDQLWELLREIGVQGVYLRGLKSGGLERTAIGIDPKWQGSWDDLRTTLKKRGIALINDSIGNSTGVGPDFLLALKNVGEYPGLYHLVEIDPRDWNLLPQVRPMQLVANIPWLSLEKLQKKGYVSQQFSPYVKESSWNASGPIACADGITRRWIYLKQNAVDPVIDWLNPTFAGNKIAAADALDSIYNLGAKIIKLDSAISVSAKETLALWARKIGAFSVMDNRNGLDEMKNSSADLMTDTLTRPALLHAMLAQDAGALKLMYRLFLQEGIETKRLVHTLQPFDEFTCDWSELLLHPKRQYRYYEETLTGEALRQRLIREDAARLTMPPNTWPALCQTALGVKDFKENREDLTQMHLLLALFYAMQPGAFSFSADDLLGTFSKHQINLMACNENTLYASLPGQMGNRNSFAMQLRKMLSIRRENSLESGELIAVPTTAQANLMILVHRLKSGMLQILGVNFGKAPAQFTFDASEIKNTTAIDLMSALAEKKPLDSSTIHLNFAPLSGKVILFQTKYFD